MCELLSLNEKISSLSENLEKVVNDMKVQDRNVDLLHENIKILQNELSQKNEIIKSLMEIQSTVFDSLSAGRNDQTISDQQQQQQHQQQQQQQQQQSQQLLEHNKQTMYEQHQQQIQQNQHTQKIELSQQQQQQQQQSHYRKNTQQQQIEPKNENRSIYAGNLHISVTENDLYDFFGLRSTKYLQETCKVNLPLCKRTGKSKGYAFLNVPDHVYSEIVKLNGVEFKSKQLVLEEAKTKHKDRTLDKQNPPDNQLKNYHVNIMYQHEQQQGHQDHQLQQRQKEQHSQQEQQHQLQHKQYNHNKKQHQQQPQYQQQLHQQVNHQYQKQLQLRPNSCSPQIQQHTRQEKPQQESQPVLKKPTSHQNPDIEPLTSEKRNVIIFGDSILKGINTRLLNTNLIKSKAISKCFPGTSSINFIHYIKPTLQNSQNPFESAILHMGVNDLLKRDSNIDAVTNNIMKIASECKPYGIKNIFISGLTINNRLHSDLINTMNHALKLDCIKYGYHFIENSNILPDNLWQDGLHLNSSGKGKLLNNFLVSLNKSYFLSKTFIQ